MLDIYYHYYVLLLTITYLHLRQEMIKYRSDIDPVLYLFTLIPKVSFHFRRIKAVDPIELQNIFLSSHQYYIRMK
jgi:hypothetical protein